MQRLSNFVGWLEDHHLKGHIGEIAAGNNESGWNVALDRTLTYAKAHNLELDYWAAGPTWGTYPYSIEFGTFNKMQAAQMVVLAKYLGSAQPNIYMLSGPERGVTGASSTNFTLEYRGYTASSVTLSLSDGGKGGTFTPSQITFEAGSSNPKKNFTYTGLIDDTYSISVANNVGWVDPAPVGYATSHDLFLDNGAVPTNIYAFRRVYAPYIGPLIRLVRDTDNAQKDFGFTTNGKLNTLAIQSWANGKNTRLRLVKWYDQTPAGRDILPVFSANSSGGSIPTDYPIFLLDGGDGYPLVEFVNHRADFLAPLNAITQQSIITYINHKGGAKFLTAQFSAYNSFLDSSASGWALSVESTSSTLNMGLVTNSWHNYSGTWMANTLNGWNTYKDGSLVASQNAIATSFTLDNANNYNLGWFRWWGPTKWQGQIREIVLLSNAVPLSTIQTFNTDIANFYSIPFPTLAAEVEVAVTPSAGPALPTTLKGVNTSGGEGGDWYSLLGWSYTYPTNAEIAYFHSKGMTVIRLPFDADKLQPVRNSSLNMAEVTRINNIIQYCRSIGMWVILDPHNYGQLRNSNHVYRVIGVDGDMPSSNLADLWTRIAKVFVNQPNVIFNLMNEPYSQSAAVWKNVAVDSINAIRATGATQKILIPGTSYTGAHSWVSSGNAAAWAGFTDSNFAFEMHQYLDSDNSGTHAACTSSSGSTRLVAATNWLVANNYKGFLGEVGWSTDSTCPAEGNAIMSYMAANASAWSGWTYWASGTWLGSYMFSLQPTGLGTSTVTDAPQMGLLLNYL